MRIGFVRRGHSDTGGAEAYLLRLAAELQKTGEECVLITTSDWPTERWPFGRILRIAARGPKEFAEAFGQMETGCDVHLSLERVPGCDVFRAGDGVHAAWLERRNAFEPLWKRLGRLLNRKHKQVLELERMVFDPSNTQAVIVNSKMVRDEILARFPYPAEKIHLVPNGVRPFGELPPRDDSRKRLGLAPDLFCPLFLGTGWERKGLTVAIQAVEMLESTELLVAGRGRADFYPCDKARFLGPVSDLPTLFAAADLLVAPTWYDPFSNACLEALSAGLPVITTAANGFSEILEPGVHGEIVPAGDSLALAEALETWKTSGRPESARAACRKRAAEFSIERNARETLQILKTVTVLRAR
jgi:UDP-glucose:(heptosyl)LPS alpha-1,3-glucosyltransferase